MSDDNSTDVALRDGTDIDGEIRKLTALAHSGQPADEAAYERAQPSLRELISAKARGEQRVPVAAAQQQQRAVVASEGSPSSVAGYAPLPDHAAFDHLDHRAWHRAMPGLLKLGISSQQASGLANLLTEASEGAQAERAEEAAAAREVRQRDAEKVLRDRHGAAWRQRLADANRALTNAKQHDRNVQVGNFVLSDGSRLGDHPAFISLVIDFVERG